MEKSSKGYVKSTIGNIDVHSWLNEVCNKDALKGDKMVEITFPR